MERTNDRPRQARSGEGPRGNEPSDEVLALLLTLPGVRPEAVARARAHLLRGPVPSAGDVAQAVLDHHGEPVEG